MMRDFLSFKILVYLSLLQHTYSFGNQLHLGPSAADNISLLMLIRTGLIVAVRCVKETYIFIDSLWTQKEIVET
jgi:hypothetical protein